MIVYIVEYAVWDPIVSSWMRKISQEGYKTLNEAEDFCMSRGAERTIRPMVFKDTSHGHQEKYIIYEVYIK